MDDQNIRFSEEAEERFRQYVERAHEKRGALLPTLRLAQKEFGYLSYEVIEYVAHVLGLNKLTVMEVASFYTMLYREPVGRHVIQLCTNVSCMVNGADDLGAYLRHKLKIEEGGTTRDSLFTFFSTIACLGACDGAPAMLVNDECHMKMNRKKVDTILDAYRARAETSSRKE